MKKSVLVQTILKHAMYALDSAYWNEKRKEENTDIDIKRYYQGLAIHAMGKLDAYETLTGIKFTDIFTTLYAEEEKTHNFKNGTIFNRMQELIQERG